MNGPGMQAGGTVTGPGEPPAAFGWSGREGPGILDKPGQEAEDCMGVRM